MNESQPNDRTQNTMPLVGAAAVRRLGLGTAQFGFDYGITNAAGKVGADRAHRILDLAADAGVDLLDTAYLYGDSESVIGEWLRTRPAQKVVTKTPKFGNLVDASAVVELLHATFYGSLSRLGQSSIYGLLVHDVDDLLGPVGAAIWSSLEELQRSGVVEKIGASVYTGRQITALLRHYPLQLLQLPVSAVDGRLRRGGVLKRVAERNIEIHARSIFLQGLLLAPPNTIGPQFGSLGDAVARMARDCAAHGLARIEAALAAVFAHREIDRVIVGVTSRNELCGILKAVARVPLAAERLDLRSWEIDDEVLDPTTWSTRRLA